MQSLRMFFIVGVYFIDSSVSFTTPDPRNLSTTIDYGNSDVQMKIVDVTINSRSNGIGFTFKNTTKPTAGYIACKTNEQCQLGNCQKGQCICHNGICIIETKNPGRGTLITALISFFAMLAVLGLIYAVIKYKAIFTSRHLISIRDIELDFDGAPIRWPTSAEISQTTRTATINTGTAEELEYLENPPEYHDLVRTSENLEPPPYSECLDTSNKMSSRDQC